MLGAAIDGDIMLLVAQLATASSAALSDVAIHTSSMPNADRAARVTQASTGSPPSFGKTLPGSRLAPMRA